MNKIDVENIKRILLIKEEFKEGGTFSEEYLLSLSPLKLGKLLEDYKKQINEENISKIKQLVTEIFNEFLTTESNLLPLFGKWRTYDGYDIYDIDNLEDLYPEFTKGTENNYWAEIKFKNHLSNSDWDKFINNIDKIISYLNKLDIINENIIERDDINYEEKAAIGITNDFKIVYYSFDGIYMSNNSSKSPILTKELYI